MNIYLSVKSNVGLVAGYVDCECGSVKHGALANTRSCLQVASICGLALRLWGLCLKKKFSNSVTWLVIPDDVEDAYPVSFNFERYPYVPLPRRGRKVEFPFGDNVSLRS